MRAGRGIGPRLQQQARHLWRWLFPERIEPPPEVLRVLRAVYPTLDLDAVAFHRGVPHLVRLLGSQAITIPALLAPRRTCIYVEPACWAPESVEGLGTLVHEAYHALQAQDAGWGLGPFRPFLVLYFAAGAANGFRYHGHPMETAAYRVAGRPGSPFEAGSGGDPAALATASSDLRLWRDLARGGPLLAPFRFLLWSGAVALAWLARLLIESAGAAVALLLWGIGAVIGGIEWLLFRQKEKL